MPSKDAAIRKRSQIAKANRTMFFWVAASSAFVGIALVASVFLFQKIQHNEKVLSEKNHTITILDQNNKNVPLLQDAIRALDSNQALIDSKASPNDQAIQVILDALPSDANSLALGASLQNVLLANVPGLSLVSLQVDPVIGVESLSLNDPASVTTTTEEAISEITFRFAVSGDPTALKEVLLRLERSIRTIDVKTLQIESQGSSQVLTVSGRAFYEPVRVVELRKIEVKP